MLRRSKVFEMRKSNMICSEIVRIYNINATSHVKGCSCNGSIKFRNELDPML